VSGKKVLMRDAPALTHFERWQGTSALFRRIPMPEPEEILSVERLDPTLHPTLAQAGVRSVVITAEWNFYCLESVAEIQWALPRS
jgi:hypothetical protein